MNHFIKTRFSQSAITADLPATFRILLLHSKQMHAESLSAVMMSWGFVVVRNCVNSIETSQETPDVLVVDIESIIAQSATGEINSSQQSAHENNRLPLCVVTEPNQLKRFGSLIPRTVSALVSSNDTLTSLRVALEQSSRGGDFVSNDLRPIWTQLCISAQPIITPRQVQIIRLVAEGYSSKQIARQLQLQPKTITNHRARIMQRLDVSSSSEMVIVAKQHGWI